MNQGEAGEPPRDHHDQERRQLLPNIDQKRRCCSYYCLLCFICISLLLLLGAVVVGVVPSMMCYPARTKSLRDQNNVTQGETYLVSASDCSSVTLKINPGSSDMSGRLDVLDYTPEPTHVSHATASCHRTIDDPDTRAKKAHANNHKGEDAVWKLHLHKGSRVHLNSCALFTSGCPDSKSATYAFAIIKGLDNFEKWRRDADAKYTVHFRPHSPQKHFCSRIDHDHHTYTEEADYYHVFVNSAAAECALQVSANATFVRTEYSDHNDTSCKVNRNGTTCTKGSSTALYALVIIDEFIGAVVDLTQQMSLELTCETKPCKEIFYVSMAIASVVFIFAFIMLIISIIACRIKYKGDNGLVPCVQATT